MPSFSITPVGPFPPVGSEPFPAFIQWQWEGVDVGDRTIDTINITGATSITVGTGEESNVLTIDI